MVVLDPQACPRIYEGDKRGRTSPVRESQQAQNEARIKSGLHAVVNDVVLCADEAEANAYIDRVQEIDGKGRWQFVIQSPSNPQHLLGIPQ